MLKYINIAANYQYWEDETMSRILIVDDEAMIREVIREYANFEGYEVREAANGKEAISLCEQEDFDVIIMDLMMPGIDGFTAYEKIKKIKTIPAIILSARGEEYDKLYGFRLGIDDYVIKPFSPRELMARVAVVLSRNENRNDRKPEKIKCLESGKLRIDLEKHQVFADNRELKNMTRKEFELLSFMASNPQIVFSRDQLLNRVWGYDYAGDGRTVDTHIKMLRHSLGECRDYIVTVRGIGYKFDAE